MVWFHIATLSNPLIIFNVLVAIMNETFSKAKENLETEDVKALASLVTEHESVMI